MIFQPHGLGHQLGIDTHDVGAYNAEFPRSADPRLKRLRTGRTMVAGMVVTIEPGLYFVEQLLKEARDDPKLAKHMNFDVIDAYKKECGGYRIEDDILITDDGCYVFPGPAKSLEDIYMLRDLAMAQ